MLVKDVFHEIVKNALIKDGWTITHDPYVLTFGQRNVFVDLGAERVLAAEKSGEKIAVEVKSFQGASDIRELEMAIGQYIFYRSLLSRFESRRHLFLAVPESVFVSTFNEPIARPVITDNDISILVFNPHQEVIVKWVT